MGDHDAGQGERAPCGGLEGEPRVVDGAKAGTGDHHQGQPQREGEVCHGGLGGEGNEEAPCSLNDHPAVSRSEDLEPVAKPGKRDANARPFGGDGGRGREGECQGADFAQQIAASCGGPKGLGIAGTVGTHPGLHGLHHTDVEATSAQPAGQGARDERLTDSCVRPGNEEARHRGYAGWGRRTSSAATAQARASISAGVWVAMGVMRKRAVPSATDG